MKILSMTSIRSDYDLSSSVYRLLDMDPEIELKLLVGGAHLSPTYGFSYKEILKDGYSILGSFETLIDSSSNASRLKTASILLLNTVDVVAGYNPDLIMFGGDREDALAAALLGAYLQIPTLHLYGGDHAKDGHVDNPVRHAISKLASVHFVTLNSHKDRLIRMGESGDRIHVAGSPSLDRFFDPVSSDPALVFKEFGLGDIQAHGLVIFHPHGRETENAGEILRNILETFVSRRLHAFVSYPNTDPGNKAIIDTIHQYENNGFIHFYRNLDRESFLSIYKNAVIQVGNSSSGIIEAASIPLPVVNVGRRQQGREQSGNVIFCGAGPHEIEAAVEQALSAEFKSAIKDIKNIYGDGRSAKRVFDLIRNINFQDFLFKTEDPLELR